ncbi:JmjC domain-containing protein [Kitasatospora sp. MBT66]|uniref:JmjC domain-containing protein n=1 Tax=Kitasatospora sp. MBT66 TaxID=1444769 RepID=UPI0006912EA4|nr:cupin domain-containing protein [Kitasatospora sp. MBT66]
MSLSELLGQDAESLLAECPTGPTLYHRKGSELDHRVTLELMTTHIDHGLLTPSYTAAVKDGRAVHPGRFSQDGEMTPGKIRALFDDGHTIHLREIQRTVPYLAELCRAIQAETRYSLYVSAIISPPGSQGLNHHWDQFTAVVAQLHGRKVWPIWRPEVELPTARHLTSPDMWTPEMQQRWDTTGPAAEYTLNPGDTLVLPRGWVHKPHAVGDDTSFHLTFALRERTRLDLARALVETLLPNAGFRAGLAPASLQDAALPGTLQDVRDQLVTHLAQADMGHAAGTVSPLLT